MKREEKSVDELLRTRLPVSLDSLWSRRSNEFCCATRQKSSRPRCAEQRSALPRNGGLPPRRCGRYGFDATGSCSGCNAYATF
jgi:hypothetical protein